MKLNTIVSVIITMLISLSVYATPTDLKQIKNFRQLTPNLASAGMPTQAEFVALKNQGFDHIINLIPGDFSSERNHIEKLGMSFDQIAVDWENPKLEDFEALVGLMKNYRDGKTLIHCRLNYRASAFSYLYLVTQEQKDEMESFKQMLSVWQPQGTWHRFNQKVMSHYIKP